MKTNDILLYGGLGLAAYLLLTSSSSAAPVTSSTGVTTAPATSALDSILSIPQTLISNLTGSAAIDTTEVAPIAWPPAGWVAPTQNIGLTPIWPPGMPTPPETFDIDYYLTYQYPVMLAERPDLGQPKYVLTDAAATQYINNYLDLQGADLQSWAGGINLAGQKTNEKQGTSGLLNKARAHWQQYGVPGKRSFMAFTPFNNTPAVGAPMPPVPVAAKSGGSVFGDILSGVEVAAPIIVALAGIPQLPLLSAREVEILVTGGGIVLDMLPLYFQSPQNGAAALEMYNDFEELITQYT